MLPRTKDAGLKMVTLKQLLQRLPIALAQAKAPTKWNKSNYVFFVWSKRNC